MPHAITTYVPNGFDDEPECPHCAAKLADVLDGLYPESDPNSIGGEHHCSECAGLFTVSVFRPSAVYLVGAPFEPGVTRLSSVRARRRRS